MGYRCVSYVAAEGPREVISTMAQLGDLSTGRVRVGRTVGATEGAVEPTARY